MWPTGASSFRGWFCGPRGLGEALSLEHVSSKTWKLLLGTQVSTVLLLVILVGAFHNRHWNDDQLEGEGAGAFRVSDGYCEAVRKGLLRERANAFSNVAFVLGGEFMIAVGIADYSAFVAPPLLDPANLLAAFPALSGLFGLLCIFLGLGSFLFHASITKVAQRLDIGGVYGALSWAPVYLLLCLGVACLPEKGANLEEGSRVGRDRPGAARLVHFAVVIDLLFTALLTNYKWALSAGLVTTVLCGSMIVLFFTWLFWQRPFIRWPGGIPLLAGLFVSAAVLWVADKREEGSWGVCKAEKNRRSILQAHAVFHALCACCLVVIYLIARSTDLRAETRCSLRCDVYAGASQHDSELPMTSGAYAKAPHDDDDRRNFEAQSCESGSPR